MKKLIFYSFFLTGFTACQTETRPTMGYETLLIDMTNDSTTLTREDLEPYGKLEDNNDGMCLSLAFITDIADNPTFRICIDTLSPSINENKFQRKHLVDQFEAKRKSFYNKFKKAHHGYEESHIFRAVIRELKNLQTHPSAKKRLVVFSDLFENTPFFSYYSEDKKRLVDTKQLAEDFKNHYDIPLVLDGIVLEIRHTPTRHTADDHQAFVHLYKAILEPLGCIIQTEQEIISNIK